MKNKEYRKGNLIHGSIYFDTEEAKEDLGSEYSEEKEWDVCVIEAVCHDDEQYDFWLSGDSDYNRTKDIELTEYWIFKFGFVKQDYKVGGESKYGINNPSSFDGATSYQLNLGAEFSYIEVFFMEGSFYLIIQEFETETCTEYSCREIKTVHQFQTLVYFLNDIELTLKQN